MKKKKEKKNKEKRLSFKMVFKDSAYAIKMVVGASPLLFVMRIIEQVISSVIGFIS